MGKKVETVTDFIFLGSKIIADDDCGCKLKKKTPAPWKKSYDIPRHSTKKQSHHFADEDTCSQGYGFSSSHVWIEKLHHEKG